MTYILPNNNDSCLSFFLFIKTLRIKCKGRREFKGALPFLSPFLIDSLSLPVQNLKSLII